MRPARFAREIVWDIAEWLDAEKASMRPARFAREIRAITSFEVISRGFNEARAFCAGNSAAQAAALTRLARFNEARAFCAGNYAGLGLETTDTSASMRPARFAREILLAAWVHRADTGASMRPARFAREISRDVRRGVVRALLQ